MIERRFAVPSVRLAWAALLSLGGADCRVLFVEDGAGGEVAVGVARGQGGVAQIVGARLFGRAIGAPSERTRRYVNAIVERKIFLQLDVARLELGLKLVLG